MFSQGRVKEPDSAFIVMAYIIIEENMYSKSNNKYFFTANKVAYVVELLGDSIKVYEEENPETEFWFDGGLKHFILFINRLTDIAENISKEEEDYEIEEII